MAVRFEIPLSSPRLPGPAHSPLFPLSGRKLERAVGLQGFLCLYHTAKSGIGKWNPFLIPLFFLSHFAPKDGSPGKQCVFFGFPAVLFAFRHIASFLWFFLFLESPLGAAGFFWQKKTNRNRIKTIAYLKAPPPQGKPLCKKKKGFHFLRNNTRCRDDKQALQ